MNSLECNDLEKNLKNVRHASFFLLLFLSLLCIFFFFFSVKYKIPTYQVYEGIVGKEALVEVSIEPKELYSFLHSSLFIEREERLFEIVSIKKEEIFSSFIVTIKVELKEQEKVENRVLKMVSLTAKKTLFERVKDVWKGMIDIEGIK